MTALGATMTTRPELLGSFGAVSTTHWLASAVGISVLERGGNAFDAAAAGFALQIVEPHLCGPLGDMPAVLYSARERRVRVLVRAGNRARERDDRGVSQSRPDDDPRHGVPRRRRSRRL